MSTYIAIAITSLSIIIYFNSLDNEFVNWDDDKLIVQNQSIRSLSFQNIRSIFTPGVLEAYQPVRTLSYAIDYHFWELKPIGYHLTNIMCNACNTFLVYLLAYTLTKNLLLAALASILFAVHPVHVEAVTWLSGRRDVLSLTFALCSVYCFMLFVPHTSEQGEHKRNTRIALYCLSLMTFVLGLLTKPVIVVLPGLLILYDICFLSSWERRWRRLWMYIPFLGVTMVFFRVFMSVSRVSGVVKTAYYGGDAYSTLLIMLRVFGEYIIMLFVPQHLSVAYGTQSVLSVWELSFLILLVLLMAVLVAAAFAWKHSRLVFFGICWFFIGLLPVSNIIPISTVKADRYLYLPSVGYCLVIAWLIVYCWEVIQRINISVTSKRFLLVSYWLLVSFIFSSFVMITLSRNRDWQDSRTLWATTLDTHPNNPIALNNLGVLYASEGMYKKALALFEQILDNDAYYERLDGVMANIARVYFDQGMLDKAVGFYQEALFLNPEYTEVYLNLGKTFIGLGQYEQAIKNLQRVLHINPSSAPVYMLLGDACLKNGQHACAIESYQQALDLGYSQQEAFEKLQQAKKSVIKK